MKNMMSLCLSLCLTAALAAPAYALEYTIDAPDEPELGAPTSIEVVHTADGGAMKNEDVSKNAALIPPGFGTPSMDAMNTGTFGPRRDARHWCGHRRQLRGCRGTRQCGGHIPLQYRNLHRLH